MKGAQIALIVGGVIVAGVAVLAFLPGGDVDFNLPRAAAFKPKAKESATRARLTSMSGLTGRFSGAGTDYTLDEADVYTYSGMGDTDQFSFNDMVACWATQANFNERINTGWWGVTVDDSQCPDGGNDNGIMNFWMRGTKPLLFGLFRPTVLELVFFDSVGPDGLDAIYLVASVTEGASIENPIGNYFIQMYMDAQGDAANATNTEGALTQIKYNVFTHETDDGINALLLTLDYGESFILDEYKQAMVVDPSTDSGLTVTTYGAFSYSDDEDNEAPAGCVQVQLAAWNADYAFNPNTLYSPECEGWSPYPPYIPEYDPEEPVVGACYTRESYTEGCNEYNFYDATTGDRLEGLASVSGDATIDGSTVWVGCERSDTTAATCCDLYSFETGRVEDPEFPIEFQSWTSDGQVDVSIDAPAAAVGGCRSWEVEVDLEYDGEATVLDASITMVYNHTTGNDRNGATNPGDGSWEDITIDYDYDTYVYLPDGIVLADGAAVGPYVVRCMGIETVFELTDDANCPTDVTSYPTNLFDGVDLPYLTAYPDDMPGAAPTADEIEVFVGEDL